jgi:hypothetical protein
LTLHKQYDILYVMSHEELTPNQDKPTVERVVLTTLINPDGSFGKQSGLIVDRSIADEPQVIGHFEQDSPKQD